MHSPSHVCIDSLNSAFTHMRLSTYESTCSHMDWLSHLCFLSRMNLFTYEFAFSRMDWLSHLCFLTHKPFHLWIYFLTYGLTLLPVLSHAWAFSPMNLLSDSVTAQANCDLNVTTWTWSRSCQPNTLARPHICRVLSRQPFMLTWMSMKGLCGFMPTWTPRRLQDLDLSKEEDRKLLNGAYNHVVWCDVWGLADLTRTSAHHLSLKHILAGRVSYFSLHTHSDSRSLAFVEEYWRLAAKWSIMLRIWMCSAISYSALPRSHAQRKREYPGGHPDAKETQSLAHKTVAHSGLSTCGPWFGVPTK